MNPLKKENYLSATIIAQKKGTSTAIVKFITIGHITISRLFADSIRHADSEIWDGYRLRFLERMP